MQPNNSRDTQSTVPLPQAVFPWTLFSPSCWPDWRAWSGFVTAQRAPVHSTGPRLENRSPATDRHDPSALSPMSSRDEAAQMPTSVPTACVKHQHPHAHSNKRSVFSFLHRCKHDTSCICCWPPHCCGYGLKGGHACRRCAVQQSIDTACPWGPQQQTRCTLRLQDGTGRQMEGHCIVTSLHRVLHTI